MAHGGTVLIKEFDIETFRYTVLVTECFGIIKGTNIDRMGKKCYILKKN